MHFSFSAVSVARSACHSFFLCWNLFRRCLISCLPLGGLKNELKLRSSLQRTNLFAFNVTLQILNGKTPLKPDIITLTALPVMPSVTHTCTDFILLFNILLFLVQWIVFHKYIQKKCTHFHHKSSKLSMKNLEEPSYKSINKCWISDFDLEK